MRVKFTSRWFVDCVLLVVVGALLAVGWMGLQRDQDQRQADRDRGSVMEIARAQVIDLTTLTPDTLDGQLKALESRSAGDFKDQLRALSATFATVVADSKVSSDGEATGVAVSSLDDTQAEVLVAATATVTSGGDDKDPVVQRYRISVQLERSNGAWLISGMEFVA